MKKISLFNSNLCALVDNEDFDRVSKYRWGIQSNGYVRAYKGRDCIYLHRFIMNANSGDPEIDHKNRNRRDCRRKNLRFSNRRQQTLNRVAKKKGTSKYKGVNFDKSRNKYLARVKVNGKYINLGRFINEDGNVRSVCKKIIFLLNGVWLVEKIDDPGHWWLRLYRLGTPTQTGQ